MVSFAGSVAEEVWAEAQAGVPPHVNTRRRTRISRLLM
jgi:hypothetical protein